MLRYEYYWSLPLLVLSDMVWCHKPMEVSSVSPSAGRGTQPTCLEWSGRTQGKECHLILAQLLWMPLYQQLVAWLKSKHSSGQLPQSHHKATLTWWHWTAAELGRAFFCVFSFWKFVYRWPIAYVIKMTVKCWIFCHYVNLGCLNSFVLIPIKNWNTVFVGFRVLYQCWSGTSVDDQCKFSRNTM